MSKPHGNCIIDEWTFRDDLTSTQKHYRRHREKRLSKAKEVKRWQTNRPCRKEEQEKARKTWSEMSFEERAEYHYKKKYKLSYSEVENKLEQQNNKCVCCATPLTLKGENRGVVDHCHSTGKIRDILCNHCNKVLGLVKESENTLQNMLNYLEKWNG